MARADDAIALWCNVDPVQFASLGFDTQCISEKGAAVARVLLAGKQPPGFAPA